jgi:hypothetical protein
MKKINLRNLPPASRAELERLREQVRHAEGHNQFDTVHHLMLARFESVLGLVTSKKDMRAKENEVNDGEQNL